MNSQNKHPLKTKLGIAITGSIDSGKCFSRGTKIMAFNGQSINVEDIKVGDKLMGDDSTIRTVLETHTGIGHIYKIIPSSGKCYYVNGEHILYFTSI